MASADDDVDQPQVQIPPPNGLHNHHHNNSNSNKQRICSHNRRVDFVDDEQQQQHVLLIETIEELDAQALWWNPDDYFEIKAQSRLDAKEWRRKGYGILLKETFENPIEQAQEYLNAFCLLEDKLTRRGLERHLSRRHGEERSDLKDRARYCVLSHQRKLKREGTKIASHDMEEQLSKIYQDISRSAKVFARRLGKADEMVVVQQDCVANNALADAIVDENEAMVEGGKMERRLSNFSVQSGNSCDSFRLPPNSAMAPRRHGQGGGGGSFHHSRRSGRSSSIRGSSGSGGGGDRPAPSQAAAPGQDFFAAIA
mmetsp:Transcript_23179/g.64441  ORF Transcript_23179/g.64441 Transcript_23179/m.64441 type:complete len:312 (-) Transcript_23179:218-1153(-)|eukprot:CAMPEP_0168739254 /NCGR_PEP_ID=MMETSP0724-20121128/11358_1 /TAXON_ID=265536 /ORGANISM="Amphiprora sp., Strain CCMP467" /LENGTH=311 /DNA_ID=CAMNT_0008786631 /DNA_START=173 /DNA_END=1108 /DNA_ORIENTATION=+